LLNFDRLRHPLQKHEHANAEPHEDGVGAGIVNFADYGL
jgi:hypothetical protein